MREKFVVFETKFIAVLTSVSDSNYSSIIDGLEVLIAENKDILSKSQMLTILFKINLEFKMNEFQEKVFFEIENRVEKG
jgi:hypothetical protein